MNRRVLFAILAVGSLVTVATGCEKKEANKEAETTTTTAQQDKKLTCTMTEEEDGFKEEIKYILNYKGEDFNVVTVQGTQIYKDKYDEKAYKEVADECKEDLKDQKGMTCNAQASGSRIYITYQFTVDKLDENGWKIAEKAGVKEIKGYKYDNAKSTLEAAGYECK